MSKDNPIKEVRLTPIRNGTVIDHIACGQALNVIKILGINENNVYSSISMGIHVSSSTLGGWKDIIKIEDMELDSKKAEKIALVAPDATISIVRDYYIAEKYQVKIGERVVGLARCSNPNCITNKGEPIDPEFQVVSKYPMQLRCCYCDKILMNISDHLL
ncbi:MAG: aspartate carbamoyltransferase regulatory subunit [Thermoplasmata archaeon]|jgi:aspartate carbamoyltransferase regulatory subunit|nr:aspartate carbamoyltransferase regulatory subunit [Thermoplasmata archaeon]